MKIIKASQKINKKYGRLKVLKIVGKYRDDNIFLCKCDCGNYKEVRGSSLTSGNTKSCGCYGIEQRIKARKKIKVNLKLRKHMRCNTPIYYTWSSMKQRCLNKKNFSYKYYGGRGIKICDRWKIFLNFLEDMGEKPKGLSIDRINNDGNYCKENCRWATMKEQSNNRRKSTGTPHNLGKFKRKRKKCIICNKEFQPIKNSSTFCSRSCASIFKANNHKKQLIKDCKKELDILIKLEYV